MLNPEERHLYNQALLPPKGYSFDSAIATTFSLDLLTLLVAPLSFIQFEKDNLEEMLAEPVALLEALRTTAHKISVFCQKGRIAVPKSGTLLFSYLEKAVTEVDSYYAGGVFHPKVWVLRFTSWENPVVYRFLCLSRNLTFDRSWDTLLSFEGEIVKKRFGRNRPLVNFIETLPVLSSGNLPRETQERVKLFAEELIHVDFQTPDGFEEDFVFWPLGIKGHSRFPLVLGKRFLTVSPFLHDELIQHISDHAREHILISRPESLDGLKIETLDDLSQVYVLDDISIEQGEESYKEEQVEPGYTEAAATAETAASNDLQEYEEKNANEDLAGLHAKIFITEEGGVTRVWTGSANATRAAFNKRNVEFLVEFTTKKRNFNIDGFLAQEKDKILFGNLLRKYKRHEESESVDNSIKVLEDTLEEIRKSITNTDLELLVQPSNECFDLRLSGEFDDFNGYAGIDNVSIFCRPITLKKQSSLDLTRSSKGDLVFNGMSSGSITSFMAFDIEAEAGGKKRKLSFVLNLPLIGAPEDRLDKILQYVISNRERFIRYLLFLLAGGDITTSALGEIIRKMESGGESENHHCLNEIPLLEEMLKSFSRNPEKIERIARLVEDLGTHGGKELFPDGFFEIWQPLLEACQKGGQR